MIAPTFCPYCAHWLRFYQGTNSNVLARCVPCNVQFCVSQEDGKFPLEEQILTIDFKPVPYEEER